MKKIRLMKLLPMLITVFLVLNASAPRMTPQNLFGHLTEGQSVLVYTFVWVPLLEASMMIAQRIIPTGSGDCSTTNRNAGRSEQRPLSKIDISINSAPARVPLVIKRCEFDTPLLHQIFAATHSPLPRPWSPQSSQGSGILLLTTLVFLFTKLLPRSDVP